jgi:phosphatidylglycerophosphate synthase
MDSIKKFVRQIMFHVAGFIDYWTKGKVKPNHITLVSLLGHIPVAWALVACRPVLASVLLAFFSLLDALDGAMAKVQNSTSLSGMFFDAVSDRMKEVIVFSALAVFVYKHIDPTLAWQVVAACGTSLLISYTKAKGEMAVAGKIKTKDAQKINRLFGIGIAGYEVRVVALVGGLLFGITEYVLPLLIAANLLTIALRFIVISKELYSIDQAEIIKKSAEQKTKVKTPKKGV